MKLLSNSVAGGITEGMSPWASWDSQGSQNHLKYSSPGVFSLAISRVTPEWYRAFGDGASQYIHSVLTCRLNPSP